MTMEHFQEYGLRPFCDQLNLRFRDVLYGTNPGKWKSRIPGNRLVCILECGEESSFQDANETIPLVPGTLVLVPAFHEITHDQSETMLHLSIHFNVELYYGIDLLARQNSCWHEINFARIETIRRMLAAPDRLRLTTTMRALCWDSLTELLNAGNEPVEHLLAGYSRYTPLFDYLLHHCHAGIDVAKMAEIMRMNKETFIKKFIYDTGFSPKQFFNRLLVTRAARLLSGTDMTIREAALNLQFCNEFYFSRFFKQHLGISPRDYRKRYRISPESGLSIEHETQRLSPPGIPEN